MKLETREFSLDRRLKGIKKNINLMKLNTSALGSTFSILTPPDSAVKITVNLTP